MWPPLRSILDAPGKHHGLSILAGRNSNTSLLWEPVSSHLPGHSFPNLPQCDPSHVCGQQRFKGTLRRFLGSSLSLPPFQNSPTQLSVASASLELWSVSSAQQDQHAVLGIPLPAPRLEETSREKARVITGLASFIFLLTGITALCFLFKSGLISILLLQGPQ